MTVFQLLGLLHNVPREYEIIGNDLGNLAIIDKNIYKGFIDTKFNEISWLECQECVGCHCECD